MKDQCVLIRIFLLVLGIMFCTTPNVFAVATGDSPPPTPPAPPTATLTINSDTQMDALVVATGNTVVMAEGQDYTLDLAGAGVAFANSGTFTPNTSTVKFSGGEAQFMGGTLTFDKLTHDGAGALSIGAALTCTGLFTNTQGNFTPLDYAISASGVVWTAGAITGTPAGAWDMGTDGVDLNGGTFVATGGAFTVAGNWDMTGCDTFTPGAGSITFDAAATITSDTKSFHAVTAAADVTLADAFAAGNALTINSGRIFALAGNNCDAGAISNAGTFQMNGDETLATTTAISGGLVKFVHPAGCTLSASISGLPDVEFSSTGNTFTLGEDMAYITGNITVATDTTLSMGAYGMTLAHGRTVTNNGTWTAPTAGTFTCTGSAVFAGNSGINLYNFTADPAAGATLTFADGVTYTVGGVLTLTGAGSGADILNIAKSGTGDNAVLSKTDTGSVAYVHVDGVNGVAGSDIVASNSWGENYLYWQFGTGTATAGDWNAAETWASGHVPGSADDVTVSHDVALDLSPTVSNLTIDAAKTLACGAHTFTANGETDISGILTIGTGAYTANDSFDAAGGNVTFTDAGTLNLAGTIDCGGLGTFTPYPGCTVAYQYAGDQNVSAVDYYHLSLSGSGTKTLCDDLLTADGTDIDGNLTIASGVTFDVDSDYDIDIAGNWTNNGSFSARAGTVTFTGDSDATVESGYFSFYELVLDKETASDTLLIQTSDLWVSHALTITRGMFNLAGIGMDDDVNVVLGGALSIGVDGLWTRSNDTVPKTITFTGAACTFVDNSSGGPQNLGQVRVATID